MGTSARGFTLIELSIVLVIIGLIVGGILVGQNLITASGVRATIAQIEKYQTAVNTFRGKYGYLPGDIKDPDASQFGLQARGAYAGQGDGNGVLQGNWNNTANTVGGLYQTGEPLMFWKDLSAVHLIDGSFTAASPTSIANIMSGLDSYLPAAKLGGGSYIYVWSGGYSSSDGTNYFSISHEDWIISGSPELQHNPPAGLTVSQAYNIDKKIDDGMPQGGNVLALYLNASPTWGWGMPIDGSNNPTTSASPSAPNTCVDNAGVNGATITYSLSYPGTLANCGLTFRFQ